MTRPFGGFLRPNYTPVPDTLFDELMADLSSPEVKVLLYIIRRTLGFKREQDAISLNQISDGLTKRDGTRLDRGTGLSRSTVIRALHSLEERGVIVVQRRPSPDKNSDTNRYALRWSDDEGVVSESDQGSVSVIPPWSTGDTGGGPLVTPTINRERDTGISDTPEDQDDDAPLLNGSSVFDPDPAALSPAPRIAGLPADPSSTLRLIIDTAGLRLEPYLLTARIAGWCPDGRLAVLVSMSLPEATILRVEPRLARGVNHILGRKAGCALLFGHGHELLSSPPQG